MEENKILKIEKGTSGWGGPLYIKRRNRNKILSMTAGGIHEVTLKIKELLGCEIVDGFKTGVSDEEVAVVIIDCGGTARCGVYPKKNTYNKCKSSWKNRSFSKIYNRRILCIRC